MNGNRKLVLDANILLRAVFGKQVYALFKTFEQNAEYYVPDYCIEEARRNLRVIASRKRVDSGEFAVFLDQIIAKMILVVDNGNYRTFEDRARARIAKRDPDDWPVVATALLLNAPIWTEDRDFFGCGIATWTTDRIELYLRDA